MKKLLLPLFVVATSVVLFGCNDETVPDQKAVDGFNKLRQANPAKGAGASAAAPAAPGAPGAPATPGAPAAGTPSPGNPGAQYGGK